MIRIIHITDFHLNDQTLRDWNNFVKDKMLAKLKVIHDEKNISFIAFTGDLIDIGGKDFKSATKGFDVFKKEVIEPILNHLKLAHNQFLFIPGNHDIDRSKDTERDELGSREYFKNPKKINEFIVGATKTNDFTGMQRIKEFKDFEKSFYTPTDQNIKLSIFGSSFKLKSNDGESVGICCLNSAWRCYGTEDKINILIGEEQLVENTNFIKDCSIKVALMHHPIDWISVVEQKVINSHLSKDFDVLLIGHVHENMTSLQTGYSDSLFINLAPSSFSDIRTDSINYANGFTVIDFNKNSGKVHCEYYKYNHLEKNIIINSDVGEEGVGDWTIPDKRSTANLSTVKTVLENIREDHFAKMDEHLICQKASQTTYSIKEAFIFPPIDEGNGSNSEEPNLELTEIAKSRLNFMFFGGQETGKTTLLFRLVREFVDEHDYLNKVPVYIDFEEMGSTEINTCIKSFLRCGSKEVNELLESNNIVLLVDNLHYRKNGNLEQYKKFEKLLKEFNTLTEDGFQRELRIIATSSCEISGIIPMEHIELCKIPFKNYFIRSLKAKEIKSLMKLWIPNEDDLHSRQKLDKMLTNFNSFALPSTAMAVSLYLWSVDTHERKPINHAVLLENFLEILLQKLSKENIYRDKFDFTNKVQILAKIAQEMLLKDQANYSLAVSEFEKVVEEYLTELVGFDFEADKIVNYFLERKIFVKYQGNRVKFTYSCYFHFFLAKRMEHNVEFKDYVMEEGNYFNFSKEIDYYTALKRNDKALFETILKRFEERFKATDFILEQVKQNGGLDKYFTPMIDNKPQEPVAKKVEINTIKANRPTEQMLEEFQNKRLQAIPEPTKLIKKEGKINMDVLLILMSNVLRNSEGVEDRKLKLEAYKSFIKYNLIFSILYREHLIEYVIKNKTLPPTLPRVVNLGRYLNNIPYFVQMSAYHHMGTAKLAPIILDKIKQDKNGAIYSNSDIERYLSVALYSDIQGKDYPKYIKTLIKTVGSNIVRDYLHFKLTDYLYKRTRPGSENEEIYIDLLAELRIRTQNSPRRLKESFMKKLADGKKNFDNRFGK